MYEPTSILLIDDDDVNNYIVSRVFFKLGLADKFSILTSAHEALCYIKNNAHTVPELILVDMQMPLMSGIEFLGELKKLNIDFSSTSILPISSSIHPRDKQQLEELGLKEVILKPITIEKIEKYLSVWSQKAR